MSKHVKHVPQHRAAPVRTALPQAPRRAVRNTVVLSSVAVAATGLSVAGGVASSGAAPAIGAATLAGHSVAAAAETSTSPVDIGDDTSPAAAESASSEESAAGDAPQAAELGERAPVLSRSDRREVTDPAKEQALAAEDAPAMTASEDLADNDPREIGRALLGEFGFSADQFGCLDSLWTKESGWDVYADNPTSSAYGIPQSLPGSKMASAGSDWATNPVTQIRWGLGYIQDRYGSPCSAWGHSQAVNWY